MISPNNFQVQKNSIINPYSNYIDNATLKNNLNEYFKPYQQSFIAYSYIKNAQKKDLSVKKNEALNKIDMLFENKDG